MISYLEYCLSSGTLNDQFHTYTVDWQPTYISFEIDGQEILRVDPGNIKSAINKGV